MQLSAPKKAMATGAVLLGVLLGAAGIAAATTGSAPTHRQTNTTHDVPEANDTPDAVDTPEANDVADAPDAPEQGDHADTPDTPEPGDHADTPASTAAANAFIIAQKPMK